MKEDEQFHAVSEKDNGSPNMVHSETSHQTPSSSPKRNLKPISPHKYDNGSSGRLSFLQSDSLDDHFEHIHESHDVIMNQLTVLEASTQQTQADVGQLYDRSKNNNQNLNKLLNSIAEYSREVTEEGSATKTDVAKIMAVLDELRDVSIQKSSVEDSEVKREKSLEVISETLKAQVSHELEKMSRNHSSLLEKLSGIETQLGGLKVQNTFGEFRSRVENLAQENSKQINEKLSEVVELLQSASLERNSHTQETTPGELATKVSYHIDQSVSRLESLLASQTKTIDTYVSKNAKDSVREDEDWQKKQAIFRQDYEILSEKHEKLEKDYTDLESKYSLLESHYDAKIRLFHDLQKQFVKLGEESKSFQDSMGKYDPTKYDRVQELQSSKLRESRNITPLQKHRVLSMPSQGGYTRYSESNNSDIEE
ncbi:hypothetical protein OXX80_002922 [Metschnikowia pulcherrima]